MTRDDVLAAFADRPIRFTPPGGRDPIYLRPWTAEDRQKFYHWQRSAGEGGRLYERLFVLSVCDEGGKRLFADDELESVGGLSGAAVEAVAERVLTLNGLREGDPGKAS